MAKKSTTRKSPIQPSPHFALLEQLVVPAFEAESEPQDDGPPFGMSDPANLARTGIHRLVWMPHGPAFVTDLATKYSYDLRHAG